MSMSGRQGKCFGFTIQKKKKSFGFHSASILEWKHLTEWGWDINFSHLCHYDEHHLEGISGKN